MQIFGRQSNAMVVFLAIGVLAGALVGYATRPESAEIRIGPLNIEITGKGISSRREKELTSSQVQHIALLTLIGGAIGLGFGFAVERGNIKL
jgi:hypothetical protein